MFFSPFVLQNKNMNFIRAFFADFKKTLNGKTVTAILLTALLCFFSTFETGEANPPTVAECLIELLKTGETKRYLTALNMLSSFDSGFWFYIILPVILSVPSVSVFYDEWGSGYYFNIHRCGIFNYSLAKAIAYSLNSFLCFTVGAAVFALPIVLVFPCGAEENLSLILLDFFNTAAVAAAYPLIAVELLILIKEKFFALSIPMLVNYICKHIGGFLYMRSYYENNSVYRALACFLTPSFRYKSFEEVFGLPFAGCVLLIICLGLLFAGMYFLIKRRIRKGD